MTRGQRDFIDDIVLRAIDTGLHVYQTTPEVYSIYREWGGSWVTVGVKNGSLYFGASDGPIVASVDAKTFVEMVAERLK